MHSNNTELLRQYKQELRLIQPYNKNVFIKFLLILTTCDETNS